MDSYFGSAEGGDFFFSDATHGAQEGAALAVPLRGGRGCTLFDDPLPGPRRPSDAEGGDRLRGHRPSTTSRMTRREGQGQGGVGWEGGQGGGGATGTFRVERKPAAPKSNPLKKQLSQVSRAGDGRGRSGQEAQAEE